MNPTIRDAIFRAVEGEPFARKLKISLIDLTLGHSVVEMIYHPDLMANIYGYAHGGALFALIDEAFETAAQTHGSIAVALNINVTYVRAPEPGQRLRAEAREVARTRKTATYDINVRDAQSNLIATCQALAYRTGKPIPFLDSPAD